MPRTSLVPMAITRPSAGQQYLQAKMEALIEPRIQQASPGNTPFAG